MFKFLKDEVEYHDIFGTGHGVLRVTVKTLFCLVVFPVTLFVKLYKWVYGYED